MPVQFAQIVRGAGEQPFAFACGEAAAGHHGQFLAGLELPEGWFHGAGPHLAVLFAAVMPQASRGAGGGREVVEVPGSLGRAVAVPPRVFARILGQRREEPQLAGVGAGEVLLADITGIGEHGAQLRADPGLVQLLVAGIQERVEQGAAGWVLAEHRAGDDLVCGDHDLAVVTGHVAFLVAHHPDVRAGGVRPGLGAGPVRARRLIGRAVPAPFPGCRGSLPRFLLGPLRLAARLVLGGKPVPGPGQPLPPFGPAGQRPRVAGCGLPSCHASSASAAAALARIFSICGNVRFALFAALPASLVPSRLSVPNDTMPSAASSRSTWLNSPSSAFSCRARNRTMVA